MAKSDNGQLPRACARNGERGRGHNEKSAGAGGKKSVFEAVCRFNRLFRHVHNRADDRNLHARAEPLGQRNRDGNDVFNHFLCRAVPRVQYPLGEAVAFQVRTVLK